MLAYAKSDIGLVRKTNEDSFAIDLPYIFVVADGMGGHAAGEVASATATDIVKTFCRMNQGDVHPRQLLEQAILEANRVIYQQSLSSAEFAGMGTTITAVLLDGANWYWGHVGDSRLYYACQGTLTQLTNDHSLVGEMVRNGALTAEEALVHPQRNILTRAVGTNDHVRVETGACEYKPNSRLLLCTDGLTNMVSDEALSAFMLNETLDGPTILDLLISEANNAGGFDNITAIFLEL